MKKITFVITFLLLNTYSAFACVCLGDSFIKDPIGNALKKAQAVFSGKVVSAEFRKGYPNRVMEEEIRQTGKKVDYQVWVFTFEIERIWKGAKAAEITIVSDRIKTDSGTINSSCDYYLKKGERYLVYAYKENGFLRIDSCGRTQELFQAETDLKRLGKGKQIARSQIR
jgi:hypothetical protein